MKNNIIIAVIVAIGLVALIMIMRETKKPTPIVNTNKPTGTNSPLIQAGTIPELVIDSPQPAGDRVTVAMVTIPVHGFVVIYEDVNGQPGNVVGASNLIIFPKIENMSIIASIVKGKSYIAGLVEDSGNGLFDPNNDYLLSIQDKVTIAFFTAD